jgi:hypothetical protein
VGLKLIGDLPHHSVDAEALIAESLGRDRR